MNPGKPCWLRPMNPAKRRKLNPEESGKENRCRYDGQGLFPWFRFESSSKIIIRSQGWEATVRGFEADAMSQLKIGTKDLELTIDGFKFGPHWQMEVRAPDFQAEEARLQAELTDLAERPIPCATAGPKGDNLFEWSAVIEGPANSVYDGGIFFLDLVFPENYPYRPPKLTFRTRIFHCNIGPNGVVALPLIKDTWNPTVTLKTLLSSLVALLQSCNYKDFVVEDIAGLYVNDRERHDSIARRWTARYAR